MRTDTILFFSSLVITAFLIGLSKPTSAKTSYSDKTIGAINQKFKGHLNHFADQVGSFERTIQIATGSPRSIQEIRKEYKELRVHFVKVSFLLEYLDTVSYTHLTLPTTSRV